LLHHRAKFRKIRYFVAEISRFLLFEIAPPSWIWSARPQGVLALLSGFYEHLFYAVYAPLGDVWDILVLVNSAVNFVVYCTMNRRFRYDRISPTLFNGP